MKLTDFKVLSFDCYGTLIDWETGLWSSLQPLLATSRIDRETALTAFGLVEPEQEHETPTLPYRDILARVHAKLATRWNLKSTDAMDKAFGLSVGTWPPFPDTVEALAYLKRHYKLVILSNVDRQNFTATNRLLRVEFDAICTAEDIGSYKPDLKNFAYLIAKLNEIGSNKRELLHTAQSLYHDHTPAERANIARCWINRRADQGKGSGATKAVDHMPKLNFEFPTLAAMAEAHRKSM
ncbi:MAG: HAD hydrolase-like protein [Alphaproteobacteria bacterium]|nr:HAD hydrolase-like protein [Alphaproteobacteria bacterium]